METQVSPSLPSVDARWDVVKRVAASAVLHRSPRLRELLLYICDRSLNNRPEDLREQQIGCAVFGRQPDYSPGEDNIVRVEIRQLRKRLEEYFASEGRDEPFLILIPKGAYVPVFEPREAAAAIAESHGPAILPFRITRPRGAWFWIQTALILALATACVWLWQQNRKAEQRAVSVAHASLERGPLWPLLFNESQPANVVCADSTLVVAQSILHRSISLEQYVARDYSTVADKLSLEANSLLRILPRWQFTDITDVRLVQRLYRLNADHWGKVSVRSAKTTQIQDFKDGNSILLGSIRSNLWNRLFEPALSFRFDFDEQTRAPFIRNTKPLPGEQDLYRASKPGDSGAAYSTIALVPNLRHTGNVLIIAGTTGESTEATGEFITNTKTSSELMNTLMRSANGRVPYFEVLLRSRTLAGVAENAEIVATHILPGETPRN